MNAIIFLNFQSDEYDTLKYNVKNAGYKIDFITSVNEVGIANAINTGLRRFNLKIIDYVTVMANDIIEPENWLAIRNEFMKDKTIGISSIQVRGFDNDTTDLVGNFTISSETIRKVGAFNEELDPYGAIDLDYCTRVRAAGLHTKFITNGMAQHIEQNGSDKYGYNKLDLVKKTWELHAKNVSDYQSGAKSYYIPL
ncbi:hypothetical protein UFOVP19_39 [uncultured Caudovirales phage]|uniref:Glycosyltransferase 2-like n=1 Tax=uncultured Caudovirales phage TaxID=2100421 RepID=A0A6J5KKL6_9CAUD|nr:hypothetical protein UFOVP19_39 [uncultured Caudovirales phage]